MSSNFKFNPEALNSIKKLGEGLPMGKDEAETAQLIYKHLKSLGFNPQQSEVEKFAKEAHSRR